ncbi:MarR family EPS-associated transcriptional regulator [Roseateles amylovorans]|uniref:MarR family EPS-associated transcriptional regulator n=1 Tax=Roseateles amylovorans TaxID=2978473 RepID=A0ABY6AXC4_9BURK|nr:MarR family EPS-associated transcriptional regulator [Roseateles amylovorans]UXH77622.1 MarR family EPS-associated transcriptional regulator [Roseateles amylovorans]
MSIPPTQPPEDAQDASTEEGRLMVLRALELDPHISQRSLSKQLGISLGKTHYLLQALLNKGLVKMRNFERSDHKLAYSYLLTPVGLIEKARMTKEFLQRKEAEFEALRRTIDSLHDELRRQPPCDSDADVTPSPNSKS